MYTYFDLIPRELNEIILSKLNYDELNNLVDISTGKLKIIKIKKYENLFVLNDIESYNKFKLLINLNVRMRVIKYIRMLPNIWNILYFDTLLFKKITNVSILDISEDNKMFKRNLIHLNKITSDLKYLYTIYLEYPNFYEYIGPLIELSIDPHKIKFEIDMMTISGKNIHLLSFIKTGIYNDVYDKIEELDLTATYIFLYVLLKSKYKNYFNINQLSKRNILESINKISRRETLYDDYICNWAFYDHIFDYIKDNI